MSRYLSQTTNNESSYIHNTISRQNQLAHRLIQVIGTYQAYNTIKTHINTSC